MKLVWRPALQAKRLERKAHEYGMRDWIRCQMKVFIDAVASVLALREAAAREAAATSAPGVPVRIAARDARMAALNRTPATGGHSTDTLKITKG